jgi:hypothetical protein
MSMYGARGMQAQVIPDWPYSVVAALEPGRASWAAVLDAVRLSPYDDEAETTAAQVREVIVRLIQARRWITTVTLSATDERLFGLQVDCPVIPSRCR